ncbi:tandem-95 repeat protein, partial [Polaribacter sp.]|nr:tandem-95 repeat protein [Polaribacter sp.]
AVAEATSVFEDAPLTTIDVVSNDTDVDGDTLTLLAATSDGNGIIEINADGLSIDYTPAANFNGIEIITYTVSDGELSDTTGTLTITVTTVKDPPVAVADTETVLEDAALTSIDVISNDTDSDGDTLILSSVSTNGSGTVTVNPNRLSVDYTPASDFNGTEIVTYVVSDRSFTATGTLTITVTPVNDAPVAIADIATVIEDATLTNIDVVSNDIHGDGDTLTLTAVSSDGNGIIAINEDGLSVDYTPAADFNGTETIIYTVSESEGDETDETGTLTITVTSVNDLPIAVADELTVEEDAALTSKDVIENDTDIVEGDTLTLTAVVTDGNGTVAVNADGVSVDYTPASNFNGIETITYTVSDGTDTVTSTLTITVTEVNDAPVAVADIATVIEDATLTSIDVINNDTDFDGDTLTLTTVASDGNGTIEINADGVSVDYIPASDFDGTEIITYTVFDGELSDTTGTLTITVTPVNDNLPIAVADVLEIDEDAALTSTNVIENDTDLDTQDTLTLTTVVTDGNGTVAVNADGLSVDYTPALNFNGIETITYTLSDGTDTDSSGTLTITVNPINDAPVANDDREIIPEDSSTQFFEVLSNDTDVEDDYLYITELSTNGSGIIVLNEDSERINYTPAQGFKGTEIVTYTVTDGDLEDSTGTLTILVSNDAREITAITSNSSSQVETGSFEITATISSTSDVDVVIPFTTSGDAIIGKDYNVDFATKGAEFLLKSLTSSIRDFVYADDGRLVTINQNQGTVDIYELDGTTSNININDIANQGHGADRLIKDGNNIYFKGYQRVSLINMENLEVTADVLPSLQGTSSSYLEDFDVVNNKIFFMTRDEAGIYKTQSQTLGQNDITTIGQGTGYPIDGFNGLVVDDNENIYYSRNDGIYIKDEDNVYNRISLFNQDNFNLSKLKFINNALHGRLVNYNANTTNIIRFDSALESYEVLNYNLESGSSILNFSFTDEGQLAIYVQDSDYNQKINGYKSLPEIIVSAGQTIGTFMITGIDDDFYEFSESIIVSPGIPVNASYADALSSNGNAMPLTLELSDDDEKADVTFAFSSPTIQEFPYETVTLTATLSAVSGVDVTVPFTLSANASTTVDVSATEILIAAGQTSGSVSISTTEAFDDSLVEIQESITFSFDNTTIVNATTSETDVALIVLSDDNPVITSIGSSGGIIS